MKRKILALGLAGVLVASLTACGNKTATESASPVPATQTPEATITPATQSPDAPVTVKALPSGVDIKDVDDCTLPISLDAKTAYDAETNTMTVTLYDQELFDAVEITQLKEGDTVVIEGDMACVVKDVVDEDGYIIVNGGRDKGGLEFRSGEGGTYVLCRENDYPSYALLGEYSFSVPDDMIYSDASDPDNESVSEYSAKQFIDLLQSDDGELSLNPRNATIHIENGAVTEITRSYMP